MDEYLNFWIYGNLTELKIQIASISYEEDSSYWQIIDRIFSTLVLRGIRDVNEALTRAESMGSSASEVDENELFELAACQEAIKQMKNQVGYRPNIDTLIATQVHCLQSRSRRTRNFAADNLFQIDSSSLQDKFNQYYQPNLLKAVHSPLPMTSTLLKFPQINAPGSTNCPMA